MPIQRSISFLLNSSRKTKSSIFLSLDVILIVLALWLSFFLRLDTFTLPHSDMVYLGLIAPVIAIPIFIRNGLYRAVIRYLASDVIWAVLRAVTFYCMIWAVVVLFSGIPGVPRSVVLINWVVCLIFIGGSRFFAQWLTNVYLTTIHENDQSVKVRKVLIYGAGEAGVQLASGLATHRGTEVIGFIDDANLLHNQFMKGIKVYSSHNLDQLVEKTMASEFCWRCLR